jgi:hypothetical protein
MEIIPHQRGKFSRNYFEFIFLAQIILEPTGGWDGLELAFPSWKTTREDWTASNKVISYDRLK